jgi:hypothetical protein
MKVCYLEKHFSEETGKLHIPCPHSHLTGIKVHVVIKDGYCYRSRECMVIKCKFSYLQTDLKSLLSLTW